MKRLVAAVAVCVLVAMLVGEMFAFAWNAALPGMPAWAWPAFWPLSALGTLAGVAVGAFIARGRFLLPALALWSLATAASLTVGFNLQVAALPMTFLDYFARNLPGISYLLVASACGLALGRAAHSRWSRTGRAPNSSSKPTPLRGAA